MPLAKPKSRSRRAHTTMITHPKRAASLHEPETPSLEAGQLGRGHMLFRSIGGVLDGREVCLGRGATQFGNRRLLGQVEVLG